MNISKYDFHDGYLINLNHFDNKIELLMESAEISDEELKDNIVLSKNNTIIGKLHLDEIRNIKIDGKDFFDKLVQVHDEGNIFSFFIKENELTLLLSWINHPPKIYEETDFVKIEIEAEKIWWENIPDLPNPFRD